MGIKKAENEEKHVSVSDETKHMSKDKKGILGEDLKSDIKNLDVNQKVEIHKKIFKR